VQKRTDGESEQALLAIEGWSEELGHFTLSQSVLDHAPIGMMLTSADDELIWANLAMKEILKNSRVGQSTRSFLAFVHTDDRAEVAEDTIHLLSSGEMPELREFRWLGHDMTTHWAAVQTSIALGESGEPMRYGESDRPCVIRQIVDISSTREAEQQLKARNIELERSNEELTQFAYVASHDLSEPLRVISGHVELLAKRYSGQLDEDADRYIAFAVDGCIRLRSLIEDLLSYSRIGREVALQPVDCGQVMDEVRSHLGPALKDVDGKLIVDCRMPTVFSDRPQLVQVFTNLVANSLKYSRPGVSPEVHITALHQGDAWKIDVSDNGIGVPEKYRERVFRIFQRLHGRDIPGTGIGLAICRKIVERQNGTIEIGDSPFGGARFTVTLPACGILPHG
jgi:signal transduction histidine kinase